MTIDQILLAIISGLVVNECCDVSPWVARKLVRWSARRRYVPPARAEVRAEELAAYIDDRPGKLFKLITALGFAAAAVVTFPANSTITHYQAAVETARTEIRRLTSEFLLTAPR